MRFAGIASPPPALRGGVIGFPPWDIFLSREAIRGMEKKGVHYNAHGR